MDTERTFSDTNYKKHVTSGQTRTYRHNTVIIELTF